MRFLTYFLCLTFVACNAPSTDTAPASSPPVSTTRLTGKTMGTGWSVVVLDEELPASVDKETYVEAMKMAIDSSMVALNNEVSNWEEESTVVRFNRSGAGIDVKNTPHFLANYRLAKLVHRQTGGAFEPTILPLTDYWGFGSGIERIKAGVDTAEVLRRKALVGMDKIELRGDTFLAKLEPAVQLDLGGSAKGYGTDLITLLLREQFGLRNFLVEIGGEMFAAGQKALGQAWRIGINLPEEGAAFNAIAETMPVTDRGVATSGNYRNYYKVGADTFSHTINPATGFPERNRLLSATVIAPDCATADAFATACMVLGPEAAMTLIERMPDLQAYFLVRTMEGEMEPLISSGLKF